jgi:hypothetical protein
VDNSATDQFEPYADMLSDDELPEFGMRLLTLVDAQGEYHSHFTWDGDATAMQMVGLLETTKFLLQLRDVASCGTPLLSNFDMATDDDEVDSDLDEDEDEFLEEDLEDDDGQ